MVVEARLRVVADCTNQQLALAAAEEAVVEWPPLHHADVCAWSRAVQTVMEGPEELPDIWGNLGKDTGATKANAMVNSRSCKPTASLCVMLGHMLSFTDTSDPIPDYPFRRQAAALHYVSMRNDEERRPVAFFLPLFSYLMLMRTVL